MSKSNRQNASLYTLNFTLNTSSIITGAKCITRKYYMAWGSYRPVAVMYQADVEKMYFNSLTFFIFFIIVLCLYYSLPHRWQNRMLLVASYIFYGWWDWRFLSLIFISSTVDYYLGMKVFAHPSIHQKKIYVSLSVVVNLTLLGFFKYYNFFIDSLSFLISNLGWSANLPVLNVILPVGISFYTFQTLSYTIDIYRGELKPTHDFLDFALFVSFFPQLVAGPIERARRLLPQIGSDRVFKKNDFLNGLYLIYWGLFKKVFVADNLGIIVDRIYGAPTATGVEYIIATWAFAWQIYCDFSGYTDIARGVAKCMGFDLCLNFRQPYLVTNPSEFWRHWHISLSSWLKDYLYIPLGGSRGGTWLTYRNLLLTMVLGGLWHGAGWTFVLWGAYHGILLIVFRLFRKRHEVNRGFHTGMDRYFIIKAFFMFQIICVSWIFFRAADMEQVTLIFQQIWHLDIGDFFNAGILETFYKVMFFSAVPLFVMVVADLKERRPMHYDFSWATSSLMIKSGVYGGLTYLMCIYGAKEQSFIYFQF